MPGPVTSAVIDQAKSELASVTQQMLNDRVSVAYWQREVGNIQRRYWAAAYRGGLGREPTAAETRVLQQELNKQAHYLRGFRADIEAGRLSPLQVANRVLMYGDRLWGEWERGRADARQVMLPQYPGDAQTPCGVGCRCSLEYAEGPDDNTVEVYWRLDPDPTVEHCTSDGERTGCVELAAQWNPLIVTKMVKKGYPEFDPEQERDDNGRWTSTLESAKRATWQQVCRIAVREDAVILDANGNLVAYIVGIPGHVPHDRATVRSGAWKDCIYIHNHTAGDPYFSPGDVEIAVDGNVAEIHAVGFSQDGPSRIGILYRPEGGWGLSGEAAKRLAIHHLQRAANKFLPQFRAGELTEDQFVDKGGEEMWKQMIKATGWKFEIRTLP